MLAMHEVLTDLRRDGSSEKLDSQIVTMAERNRLTGFDQWQAFSERYGAAD
jgi:hypothetical protein